MINRENVCWLVAEYPGRQWRWPMVIIDELSSFKSNQAERFKALRRVRPRISRVVGLTGTPNPNGYTDLWAEIFLLDQGERLEKTIGRYREKYFTPGRSNGYAVYEWVLRKGCAEKIQERIADITVSMRAADYLSLPDRIDNSVMITLAEKDLAAYRRMEREHLLKLIDAEITAANVAAVMNKLLQLAGGAVYDDDGGYVEFHDAKICTLMDIIDTAGSPVLVFYGYRHERERLLKALRVRRLHARELNDGADVDDWNSGKVPVLLAHPASVGYGLNLQAGGHVIVWYSLPWSLELYQQANARLHRQGQTEAVVVNHLIAAGTVDEQVMRSLAAKNTGQAALMAALRERTDSWQ